MNKQKFHIDNLIARYLTGEALPDEALTLDQWRAESQENEQHFAHAYTLYHGAKQTQPRFETLSAWEKMSKKLEAEAKKNMDPEPAKESKMIHIQRRPTSAWKVAAGFALIATLGLAIAYFVRPGAVTEEFASEDSIIIDTMYTGSTVSLNTHSRLNYRYDKRNLTESMELSGEAYFDLNAPDKVTTVVEAGGLSIRDIGTAFHVSAYPHRDTVLVWVVTGKVAIFTPQNPGIFLSPGESGFYIKSTGRIQAYTITQLPTWYQERKAFHFNNASLHEVAKTLNAHFEQKLIIPEHLHTCRITVSFVDESPLSMAFVISQTLGLTLEQKDVTLHLSGNGCPL